MKNTQLESVREARLMLAVIDGAIRTGLVVKQGSACHNRLKKIRASLDAEFKFRKIVPQPL